MFYYLEELLELAIPLVMLIAMIYGFFTFGRFCYIKIRTKITGSPDGNLTEEQKKKLVNFIKIFGGAQMIGLLFYVTPSINENIKILISILVMLGSFYIAFIIQDKNDNNGIHRVLTFLGQEFFGISMILLMVNKNMGYSITNVFAIWAVFNFFIYKENKRIENKALFIITLLIAIFSGIFNFSYLFEAHSLVVILVIVLLGIQFFSKEDNRFTEILHNFILTFLTIVVLLVVGNEVEKQEIFFAVTTIYMVITLIKNIIEGKFKIKGLFLYVPYIVLLMISEIKVEILYLLTIYNLLVAIGLLSEKSKYKKVLCLVILLVTLASSMDYIIIDGTIGLIICASLMLFSATCVFSPEVERKAIEGRDEDEE